MPSNGLKASPAIRDAMLLSISQGVSPESAFLAAGLSIPTWEQWKHAARYGTWKDGGTVEPDTLADIRSFVEGVAEALSIHERSMVAVIESAAQTANEKTGIPEWRAAAWLLEHGPLRSRWFIHRDQLQVDVTHRSDGRPLRNAAHELVLDSLSDDYRVLLPSADASSEVVPGSPLSSIEGEPEP